MQANIKLALKTREVFKLFERRIDGDRLFIEAILHKFCIVMRRVPTTLVAYNQIEKAMIDLSEQFASDANRFEDLLAKRKDFNGKKINFIAQFHPTITVNTLLSIRLVEFIEIYDKLIATIKLLHLAGCFVSNSDYYANIKHAQSLANQMLSKMMIKPP